MQKTYYVYVLASQHNGTLYVGVTNDLGRRVGEHRDGLAEGFTKKYGVKMLVHFEEFADIHLAIHRETRLKKWKRRWKPGIDRKRKSRMGRFVRRLHGLNTVAWVARFCGP